jgi:uncharacterized protein YbbC (DUF1343 family)
MVHTGLDNLLASPGPLQGRRFGLVCHPASVTAGLGHAVDALLSCGAGTLAAVFGPQHGVTAHTQDNMIEWQGYQDPRTGLPVHSLYGEHRKPTPEMLAGLDLMLVDLQDVGCRVYTYIWTLAHTMEACAEVGLPVMVLDRPNPIGGNRVEGPLLQPGYESFIGLYPLPLRHGLTIGEIAALLVREHGLDVDLSVVKMTGWRRESFDRTRLPWVMPSPNMPTLETAEVYPGAVLFEGTKLSEGRGTTRPFEILGGPDIEPHAWADALHTVDLPGVRFRPLWFEPTFQKHAGQVCGGLQIHVVDRDAFQPILTAAVLLTTARSLFGDAMSWLDPPYEYVHDRMPIDILAGSPDFRAGVESGRSAEDWLKSWEAGLAEFEPVRRRNMIYEA